MQVKKRSLIAMLSLLSFGILLVPSTFACGNCGVTITKEPLYSGYTYPDGTWVNSAPTSGLELNTRYDWWVRITVRNFNPYIITHVRVFDRFGAEFGVEWIEYEGRCEPVLTTNGNSDKVFLEWYVGDIWPEGQAWVVLHVWTDHNPRGWQEFTSPDTYEMNSGAIVKWLDDFGKQHSAETMPIIVSTMGVPEFPCE